MIPGLERYFRILYGDDEAKYLLAKRIPAERCKSLEDMWDEHETLRKYFRELLKEGEKAGGRADYSFLDLKHDILYELLKNCIFCERRCGVNRFEKTGFCGCGVQSHYSSEFLHFGEEPELVPSHTIFFNRCTFACVYCQNWDIVVGDPGDAVNAEKMAEIIRMRSLQGSRNVNFVGGNPDQHAHTVLNILRHSEVNLPMIWNSNMYHSSELALIIEDVMDVFLADFRYGNDKCARRLSGVRNYWKVVTRNFKSAYENSEMIIRHLVLPGHVECCTEPIVRWVSENLGKDVRFNLMFQYYPTYRAHEFQDINRGLSFEERREAKRIVNSHGLKNLV